MPYIECVSLVNLYTPPKTNIASENGPGPKRKFHLPTNHQFLVDMLVFGGGGNDGNVKEVLRHTLLNQKIMIQKIGKEVLSALSLGLAKALVVVSPNPRRPKKKKDAERRFVIRLFYF